MSTSSVVRVSAASIPSDLDIGDVQTRALCARTGFKQSRWDGGGLELEFDDAERAGRFREVLEGMGLQGSEQEVEALPCRRPRVSQPFIGKESTLLFVLRQKGLTESIILKFFSNRDQIVHSFRISRGFIVCFANVEAAQTGLEGLRRHSSLVAHYWPVQFDEAEAETEGSATMVTLRILGVKNLNSELAIWRSLPGLVGVDVNLIPKEARIGVFGAIKSIVSNTYDLMTGIQNVSFIPRPRRLLNTSADVMRWLTYERQHGVPWPGWRPTSCISITPTYNLTPSCAQQLLELLDAYEGVLATQLEMTENKFKVIFQTAAQAVEAANDLHCLDFLVLKYETPPPAIDSLNQEANKPAAPQLTPSEQQIDNESMEQQHLQNRSAPEFELEKQTRSLRKKEQKLQSRADVVPILEEQLQILQSEKRKLEKRGALVPDLETQLSILKTQMSQQQLAVPAPAHQKKDQQSQTNVIHMPHVEALPSDREKVLQRRTAEVQSLQATLRAKNRQIQTLTRDLQSKEQQLQNRATIVSEYQRNADMAKEKREVMEDALKWGNARIQQLQEQLTALSHQAASEVTVSIVTEERDKLQNEHTATRQRLSEVESLLTAAQHTKKEMRRASTTKDQKISSLNGQVLRLGEEIAQVKEEAAKGTEKLVVEVGTLQKIVEERDGELDACYRVIRKVEAQWEEDRKRHEGERFNAEIDGLRAALEEKEREIEVLRGKRADAVVVESGAHGSDETCEKIERTMDKCRAQIESCWGVTLQGEDDEAVIRDAVDMAFLWDCALTGEELGKQGGVEVPERFVADVMDLAFAWRDVKAAAVGGVVGAKDMERVCVVGG
ncbi:hypothetical protein HDV00_011683 [Rhizophlyctis rosea]|nr:hypothetical protein HDV00_011683 [Rhizophlyctis rosea]